jgi:hypothetical protein
MAYNPKATNTGMTTTLGDVGTSVTFTAVANRYYKYTFYCGASNASASGTLECYITDNANNILGTLNLYLVGGGNYSAVHNVLIRTETAGSNTRKVRAKVESGTGTLFAPMYLLVEDLGPA